MTPSPHALDRYRIHHPEAGPRDMVEAVEKAILIDTALARTMVGRPVAHDRWQGNDEYRLADDCCGVFVVDADVGKILTYLRFGPAQKAFAEEHMLPSGAIQPPIPVRQIPAHIAELLKASKMPTPKSKSLRDRQAKLVRDRAIEKLLALPLPVVGIPANEIQTSHGACEVLGGRTRARISLHEATMERRDDGKISCTFPDGKQASLVRMDGSRWGLVV